MGYWRFRGADAGRWKGKGPINKRVSDSVGTAGTEQWKAVPAALERKIVEDFGGTMTLIGRDGAIFMSTTPVGADRVGSRVLLQIPPALGYGKEGQGEDIPPNSTLYFVIDVLAAA